MSKVMNAKQQVAIHAANLIEDGMIVGLGTGSTADYFIEALARRQQQGLDVITVASSVVSTIKAAALGLKQVSFEHLSSIDVYVDGADEVTPDMTLLKGRGADLVREKLLARACDQFYVLVDKSKQVERIGKNFPIPIEVMPFAWQLVLASIKKLGGKGQLRKNVSGDGLAMTSYGSLVLDMKFDDISDVRALDSMLNAVPGVVEHGIFDQLATAVFIGHDHAELEQQWKQTS